MQWYASVAPTQTSDRAYERQQTVSSGRSAPEQHLESLPGFSKLCFELQRPGLLRRQRRLGVLELLRARMEQTC